MALVVWYDGNDGRVVALEVVVAESGRGTGASAAAAAASARQAEVVAGRRAVVKMMIICVTLFFACYTPSFIAYIMK